MGFCQSIRMCFEESLTFCLISCRFFSPSMLIGEREKQMQKGLILLVTGILSAWTYNKAVGFAIFVGSEEGAIENLEKYSKEMNYKLLGKSCAETDSDRDGYITCTGRFQGADNAPEFKELLDCGSGAWGARTGGCKPKFAPYPPTMQQLPAPTPSAPAKPESR